MTTAEIVDPACPSWGCVRHERDHEGALLHTHPVGTTALADGLGQVAVERYDLPPGVDGETEDYIWLPVGEGMALTEDEARAHVAAAQAHVALVLEAIEVLAAARRRRAAA